MTTRILAALERIKDHFSAGSAEAKLALLVRLARADLRSARAVRRLHELLCFLRAYPDDARLLAQVERMLAAFHLRADLRRAREALTDTGIAGTAIRYRFFWSTLRWLARRWPERLEIDRSEAEVADKLGAALPLLLTWAEAAALKQLDLPAFAAIDRLRARGESDAAFLARRIAAMPGDGFTREAFHDAIEPSYELKPGPDTPARTRARHAAAPFAYQREASAARAPGPARGTRAPVSRGAPGVAARRRASDRTCARRDGHAFARSRRIRLRQCARRAPGRRRRRARVCADRRRRRAAPADSRDLRLSDSAQRRADRLRRGVRDRAFGHDDFQYFRELSRRRSGLHVCANAGDGAARVRRRVVQPGSVSARPGQRRGDRLRRLVVLLQTRIPPAQRGRAPPAARGTGAHARGSGPPFERGHPARPGRVSHAVRFRPFAHAGPAAARRGGLARRRRPRGTRGR